MFQCVVDVFVARRQVYMAMSVLNNSSAVIALGQMNKNSKNLSKSLRKVGSGEKLSSASSDASSYAISTKMRAKIRSLVQDQQNVQNGNSMFKVASGGIESIIENMKRIKELTIDAANDSNTDEDRAIIQKEIESTKQTINDVAYGTEYNGRKLLDGSYYHYLETEIINFESNRSEPSGAGITITNAMVSNGAVNLSGDNISYTIASDLVDCTLNITGNNVKIIGSGNAKDISIVMHNSGDLWIQNLNTSTILDHNAIDFRGETNYLHVSGNNNITQTVVPPSDDDPPIIDNAIRNKAAIRAGGNLIISGSGTVNINQASTYNGAAIGTDSNDSSDNLGSSLSFLSGTFNIKHDGEFGAAIGAGYQGSRLGSIGFQDGTVKIETNSSDPAIGAASGSVVDSIIINGGTVNAVSTGANSNEVLGTFDINASVNNVIFRGGNIHLETKTEGVAVDRWAQVPESGFSNADKIYDFAQANYVPTVIHVFHNALSIHTGDKSNQMNDFIIDGMRTKDLGIDTINVTTQQNAESAMKLIEGALEYALDVATDVGAYMERLDYASSNINSNSENTQLSESTIRDADMAKEMTEYTKNNVLLQASSSMLSQANQNQSQILGLLQ